LAVSGRGVSSITSMTRVLDIFQKSGIDHERPTDSRVGHTAGVHPSDNADLEGTTEDLPDARGDQLLELQNPEQSGASSLVDTEVTHTDPGSGHHDTLGLELYN
jgi:hypothetical protein